MNLIEIGDLSARDIRAIWVLASQPAKSLTGTVAWSFEGRGVRTRTTFMQAFRDLGLAVTELPGLLKTPERACDLAGYLDPFYALYVLRESDHQRLREFAAHSCRPVINAMSSQQHPCEVLSDAWFIETTLKPLTELKIGLWGPMTNVFWSWHELGRVLGLELVHFCPPQCHTTGGTGHYRSAPDTQVDILITDGWPADFDLSDWSLSLTMLAHLGQPRLLPTPPFSIGRELEFDPLSYPGFTGYAQKRALLPVQRAILAFSVGHGRVPA